MLGIGSNDLEGLGSGPEENAIDGPLVLEGDIGNLFRHSKDDVKILGFQNLGLPVFDPLGAGQGLAFWTVTIRTRVEPNTLVGRTDHTLRRDRRERPCGMIQSQS